MNAALHGAVAQNRGSAQADTDHLQNISTLVSPHPNTSFLRRPNAKAVPWEYRPFFVQNGGLGVDAGEIARSEKATVEFSHRVRITDQYGQTITESATVIQERFMWTGQNQFPLRPEHATTRAAAPRRLSVPTRDSDTAYDLRGRKVNGVGREVRNAGVVLTTHSGKVRIVLGR